MLRRSIRGGAWHASPPLQYSWGRVDAKRASDRTGYYTVAMSNFRVRLRNATAILATGGDDVKDRLGLAIVNELLLANVPDDPGIPQYFRTKHAEIIEELSVRTWRPGVEGDRVRATIHPMRFQTAASFAHRIWTLYNEFEEYGHSGFIPSNTHQ